LSFILPIQQRLKTILNPFRKPEITEFIGNLDFQNNKCHHPLPHISIRLLSPSRRQHDPSAPAQILGYLETVEPLLRRRADHEIDTRIPLERVVAAILRIVDG
jgi:hypothetical protein